MIEEHKTNLLKNKDEELMWVGNLKLDNCLDLRSNFDRFKK